MGGDGKLCGRILDNMGCKLVHTLQNMASKPDVKTRFQGAGPRGQTAQQPAITPGMWTFTGATLSFIIPGSLPAGSLVIRAADNGWGQDVLIQLVPIS